jgi:hypothetical protein
MEIKRMCARTWPQFLSLLQTMDADLSCSDDLAIL